MAPLTRRTFLARSAAAATAGLAATALRPSAWAAPAGANDAIRVAIVGLGNKGYAHLGQLVTRRDVRVTALCDLDAALVARAAARLQKTHPAPFTATDPREIVHRADVDVVIVATGNHWHALLAVWACQAGKDVYVEKPMTHTVWEGRKMIEAAAKYSRIIQVGTQYRSEAGFAEGIPYLHSGALGKIRHVHGVVFGTLRNSIGRRAPWYPADVNYDLFCGPTPVVPLERDKLHYDWHWSWHTGNGDLGNNGVHMLDLALRVVRATAAPRRVLSLGGRYVHQDAADTPNTQLAVYDFPGTPVIYENRCLPAKPGVSYMDQVNGIRSGIVVHCEGGYLSGLVGCAAYDPSGKLIKKFAGDGGGATHVNNFFDAVRSRRTRDLAAPVEVGHASASTCHYGNISYRLGAPAAPDRVARALESVPAAAELCRGLQAHLGVHGVDLAKHPLTLGPWLDVDAPADRIDGIESGDEAALARARYLLHEVQRPPFAIPEAV